ncbi:hypothetical protein KQX54_002598, partial [Cotesia glomerata]
MNIRNCYFVCFDSEQTPFVFTFNPYSKYAPDQWKTVREITEKFNYMTIYNRVYNKKNICKGLHFDRTKYLDRAVLNFALCMPPSQVIPLSKLTEKNHHLIYSHFEGDIFEMLKIGLKVSLNYNYDLEPFNHTSKPSGVCNLLLNKTSDVAATFSGHLSKFLTNPELRYNAEKLEDLQSSRYEKVYVTPSSKYFVTKNEILKPKSKFTTVFEGIDAVLKSESNALISIYMGLLVVFKRMNLSSDVLRNYYLSNKFIRDNYFIYALRHDWPLTKKFNSFLILLEDTGNLLKLNNDLISDLESLLIHIKIYPEFKPIDIESILFIFYFLRIGYIAATICFIIEKWQTKKKSLE